jgi:hypothetical protein
MRKSKAKERATQVIHLKSCIFCCLRAYHGAEVIGNVGFQKGKEVRIGQES